jgi:hypothetical protein
MELPGKSHFPRLLHQIVSFVRIAWTGILPSEFCEVFFWIPSKAFRHISSNRQGDAGSSPHSSRWAREQRHDVCPSPNWLQNHFESESLRANRNMSNRRRSSHYCTTTASASLASKFFQNDSALSGSTFVLCSEVDPELVKLGFDSGPTLIDSFTSPFTRLFSMIRGFNRLSSNSEFFQGSPMGQSSRDSMIVPPSHLRCPMTLGGHYALWPARRNSPL